MALGLITAQLDGGRSPNAPVYLNRVTVVGDDSYPTGGTVGFSALLSAATGVAPSSRTVLAAEGLGKTAGALTHFAEYDGANDTLKVYLLAGAEETGTTDISAVTFDLTVLSK